MNSLGHNSDLSSSLQIRGTRDITNFLEKSEVLLDVKEEELDSIVERLLDVMMQEKYGEAVSREELTSLIFANPERTLLSEFVQGTIHKGMNQYEWEQVRTKTHFFVKRGPADTESTT